MVRFLQSAGLDRTGPARPLDGRVAIVTGSTSGIGLAVADTLAGQGAAIVLNGLCDAGEAERLCRALTDRHRTPVRYDDADLSRAGAVTDLVDRSVRAFGPVEILVNNAGIQHVGPIEDFPPEQWDAILAINLSAVFHATRRVLPDMRRRGWGRIINVASAHGLIGSPFKSAYVAAKHGVVGLTKVTALETAEAGITCNAVCPGYVLTPLVEQQVRAQAAAHGISEDEVVRTVLLAEQPTKRFATVEEVAETIAFLCGPAAASITGAAISIDGGWTAH
ncbi:3-hydroxybutyrate dehydrogenase [Methylobacterium oryzisoli]|uniref:3-hydroxybutyrate dehydrogenase n=1 Tax=Methylobacterium oryzisoli TaxID=3385502 RepID=UPI0038925611